MDDDENNQRKTTKATFHTNSDTTSITLSAVFYLLARNPQHFDKLRAEITPLIAENKPLNGDSSAKLGHLNGVINETLRLYPAVPTDIVRLALPQGITIGGTFIPGSTNIWVPQYSLGRGMFHAFRLSERFEENTSNLKTNKVSTANR